MMFRNKKRVAGILIILGTVVLSLTLVSIPTDTLLGYIGTNNAYLFIYLIAFLGSITTFASIPYPLILLSLVAGGLHPLFAGIISALGVSTADSCTFFVARRGSNLVSEKFSHSLERVSTWIERFPRLFLPVLALYGVFSPLSNDFAVISLSLMRYSFWKVIPTLALGNMIYNIGVAFLGVYAYDWIIGLF